MELKIFEPFFEFLKKGGIFMYPILFISIVSLAIFLDGIFQTSRKKFFLRLSESEFINIQKKGKFSVSEIISIILLSSEKLILKRSDALPTLASVSTLLGLLGTISGLIKIFANIYTQDVVIPSSLAGGISEALYTTAFGLSIAVPTIIFHRIIIYRTDSLLEIIEKRLQNLETNPPPTSAGNPTIEDGSQ